MRKPNKIIGYFWQTLYQQSQSTQSSAQDTRETSARIAYPAEAVFKKGKSSLKEAEKKAPHHVWGRWWWGRSG